MCVLRGCVLALALASAAASPAAAAPRLGQAGGVRIHPGKGGWVVTFSDAAAKTFRSVRGRDVTLTCTRLDRTPGLLVVDDRFSANARAPQRRRPIRVDLPVRAYDLCELSRATDSDTPVATVALSQRGAVVIDERAATQALDGLVAAARLPEAREPGFANDCHAVRGDLARVGRPFTVWLGSGRALNVCAGGRAHPEREHQRARADDGRAPTA